MIYVGLVFFVVAATCVFLMKKNQSRIRQMQATETSLVSALEEIASTIRADLGGGASHWSEKVEIKGTVVCEHPIQGQYTEIPAAVVHTRIVREWEEYRRERDSNGNSRSRWVRRSDTMHDDVRTASFSIDDGTGQLRVAPAGAEYKLNAVVDRFEPADRVDDGPSISFGPITLSAGNMGWGSSRRLLGYKIQESILPVGSNIYALGEVQDQGTSLVLTKSSNSETAFILSVKSEEELVAQYQKIALWQKIGAIASTIVGIGLVVRHFL
jgi:hypothetical protein